MVNFRNVLEIIEELVRTLAKRGLIDATEIYALIAAAKAADRAG